MKVVREGLEFEMQSGPVGLALRHGGALDRPKDPCFGAWDPGLGNLMSSSSLFVFPGQQEVVLNGLL